MLGKRHLHIGRNDQLSSWLGNAIRSAEEGVIRISFASDEAATITAQNGSISVDLIPPGVFRISDDETDLFDKLRTASEFGRALSEKGATLAFLRRGKEAVRLGKEAEPTFSKLLSRSGDIQITSVKEFAKLKKDLKTY